jgi:hypothetical protein
MFDDMEIRHERSRSVTVIPPGMEDLRNRVGRLVVGEGQSSSSAPSPEKKLRRFSFSDVKSPRTSSDGEGQAIASPSFPFEVGSVLSPSCSSGAGGYWDVDELTELLCTTPPASSFSMGTTAHWQPQCPGAPKKKRVRATRKVVIPCRLG